MSGVKLRILDASGKVVTSAKAVAVNGSFGPETLTGTGPFRLEACGMAAEKLRCLYALTPLGGTSNITPLTSAVAVLATNQTPDTMMASATISTSIDATALASAQARLRTALAPAITDAGLNSSSLDFAAEPITPGSRSGHDRLLDSVAVSWGLGASNAFVQVSPRLGQGSAYLEPGSSQGQISIDSGATSLNLASIDTLFAAMNQAFATDVSACRAALPAQFASGAQLTFDEGVSLTGSQTFVEAGTADMSNFLCQWMIGPLSSGWIGAASARLLPPELGRCHFSNSASPICRVSLVAQNSKGDIKRLASNQGVLLQSGGWKFKGDLPNGVSLAQSRAQLIRRVDGSAPVTSYTRAIGLSIPATAGLLCAKVSQQTSSGPDKVLALFQPAPSATWLSLWVGGDGLPSLDPAQGSLPGSDARWIPLPLGVDGDAVVDNFLRAGRSLKIAYFSDSACSVAFTPPGANASQVLVDLPSVPPLASALPSLPWPVPAAATVTGLTALKGAAASKLSLSASWSFKGSPVGMSSASLCTNVNCTGSGSAVELALSPSAASAALALTLGSTPLAATDFRQVRLQARSEEGLLLSADIQSCAADLVGQACSANALRQAFLAPARRARAMR